MDLLVGPENGRIYLTHFQGIYPDGVPVLRPGCSYPQTQT